MLRADHVVGHEKEPRPGDRRVATAGASGRPSHVGVVLGNRCSMAMKWLLPLPAPVQVIALLRPSSMLG
jgi:hypothetical protein